MSVLCVIVVGFTLLFYKELKLTTFDAPLAAALGFRPTWLHYALMILVSLVAVGAFNAVGSVLVVAFFIIPPATAYLLTERLSGMLILSPLIGALGAYTGYDLSRGNFLGIAQVSDGLRLLDRTVGLGGYTDWNVSISASMVLMLLVWFVLAWIFAPRHGLVMTLYRRSRQRLAFQEIMVLGHLHHHENTAEADAECAPETLHEHLHWQPARTRWVLARLRAFQWVQLQAGKLQLTPKGRQRLAEFRQAMALD
jgi:manganese/zinc/iron transport system permease protein